MASSRSIGGISASLSLRDKGFKGGLSKASKQLKSFGATSLKYAAIGGAALAGGASVLAAGTKRTLTIGADFDHLSTQTGVAVKSLVLIGQAYKDNGRDAKAAGKDIGKMQKAIYDQATNPSTTIDYFAQLGLSAKDLMMLSPEQQFFKIGAAIKSIADPTQKAAIAMGIFGKAGAGLVTVFSGTSIEDVNKSLGRSPAILDKFSAAFERADTLLGRLPNKSDQFFTGFTAGVIGELLPVLEKTNDFDFSTLGENLGIAISTGTKALTNGYGWDLFLLYSQKSMIKIGDLIANSLAAAINAGLDQGKAYFSRFGEFVAEKIADMDLTGQTRREYDQRRSDKSRDRALSAGYSPLGGGAPATAGETFAESFAKYLDYGKSEESDTMKAINSQINDTVKILSDQVNKGIADAANMKKRPPTPGPEPSGPPRPGIPATETEGTGITTAKMEVNAYQKRGLSLDAGNTADVKLDKQTNLLTEIRDGIRRMSNRNTALAF